MQIKQQIDIDNVIRECDNLVKKIAWKYRGYINAILDIEDLIQLGYIGVYKATKYYDVEKSNGKTFSNYAAQYVKGSILSELRYKKYREKYEYIQGVLAINKNGEDYTLEETLGSECENIRNIELLDLKLKLIRRLSSFDKELMLMYSDGFNAREISEKVNYSESYIDNRIRSIRNELKIQYFREVKRYDR